MISSRRRTVSFLFFSALITVSAPLFYCSRNEQKQFVSGDTLQYVGMEACRKCHEDKYRTFMETGMGKSFGPASKSKSSGKFGTHAKVYDKLLDFYYVPYWEGDSLCILEYRMEKDDTVYKRTEKISYIIGSGQHTNSHLIEKEGFLYQAPLTFYTQKQQWDLPPGFEGGLNSRFGRIIGLECLSCHNAYPSLVRGSENKYDKIPHGIDCERCHGPGSLHVKEKSDGHITGAGSSIVNPARLPAGLQLDLCSRCHLQGNAVLNEGKSFYDFLPGMKLSDVMNVFVPVYKGREEEHIMASHVERLRMSRCFIMSREKSKHGLPGGKELSCITCHNPHLSVKATPVNVFNAACNGCHHEQDAPLCSERAEARSLVKNDCSGCHMKKNGTTDIPHVTNTDHYIRKYPAKALSGGHEVFEGLTCINNPDPPAGAKARAWLQYYEKFRANPAFLDSAGKYLENKTPTEIKKNFRDLVYLCSLRKDYKKIITYITALTVSVNMDSGFSRFSADNADAWLNYRIGEAYFHTGEYSHAFDYFSRASRLSPFNPDFRNKQGAALMQLDKPLEAKKIFEKLSVGFPGFIPALSNLGYLYLRLDGDTARASGLYAEALALDPDYEPALLNKAGLMAYEGKFASAEKILEHILKKNPANRDARAALKQLKERQ